VKGGAICPLIPGRDLPLKGKFQQLYARSGKKKGKRMKDMEPVSQKKGKKNFVRVLYRDALFKGNIKRSRVKGAWCHSKEKRRGSGLGEKKKGGSDRTRGRRLPEII